MRVWVIKQAKDLLQCQHYQGRDVTYLSFDTCFCKEKCSKNKNENGEQ